MLDRGHFEHCDDEWTTPIFEDTRVFSRNLRETSDVVMKDMHSIDGHQRDRSRDRSAIRPPPRLAHLPRVKPSIANIPAMLAIGWSDRGPQADPKAWFLGHLCLSRHPRSVALREAITVRWIEDPVPGRWIDV